MISVNEKLKKAVVGIAGLGGLGSNVAIALARSGIDSVKVLTAARAGIAANHQANAIVEVLMEDIEYGSA